ncbi:hypothetical protein BDD43_4478 [Mucilaginibacter gracilis]|uniref:Uncharacterized protein n=1 Tax=Mucilaginibacter gracilis TaxID=423350 RepID=A0A495J763_9SPHI|nr:hypothetical protein [Mucilaginibacter gracilis]RKR84248.1 hypothetical protein BDD43_4478 [Mucilaginibacter gracilis]
MKSLLILLLVSVMAITARAQFAPGYYYDINGEKVPGLINRYPSGKGIMKDEGFIEFKDDDKARPQRLSASMIHGFVVGRDSFAIAHAPRFGAWTKNELDFVQVVVSGPTNLYMIAGGSGGDSGRPSGSRIQPMVSTGIGTGGAGMGGGIGINLGGGGGSGRGAAHNVFYYGETTGTMLPFKKETFVETMGDVMGDEPQVVEKIRDGTFNIDNIDGLVKYYKIIVASHK